MSVSALHLSFITSLVAQELRWWEWHRVGTSPLESSPHKVAEGLTTCLLPSILASPSSSQAILASLD